MANNVNSQPAIDTPSNVTSKRANETTSNVTIELPKIIGVAVTDDFVKKKFQFLKSPTRKDKANFAYSQREDAKEEVKEVVQKLQKQVYDDEKTVTKIATICAIYNATGVTLTLYKNHDFCGHIRPAYPPEIENGQWAVFLHVDGSSAAVLYRSKIEKSEESEECGVEERVWLHAWNNVPKAYTESQRPQHYNCYNWDSVFELIKNEKTKGTPINECCLPQSRISQKSTYIYSGIMTWEASIDCTCT